MHASSAPSSFQCLLRVATAIDSTTRRAVPCISPSLNSQRIFSQAQITLGTCLQVHPRAGEQNACDSKRTCLHICPVQTAKQSYPNHCNHHSPADAPAEQAMHRSQHGGPWQSCPGCTLPATSKHAQHPATDESCQAAEVLSSFCSLHACIRTDMGPMQQQTEAHMRECIF